MSPTRPSVIPPSSLIPHPTSIGLIAGNGIYPATFARAARNHGVSKLVACAFINETDPELQKMVDIMEWMRVGQLSRMIKLFHREGIRDVVMVGQIAPKNLFDLRPDLRALLLLGRLKKKNAESIFGGIGDELAKEGITLLPATTFLEHLLPGAGLVAGPAIKKRRWSDVEYGLSIAREISRLDIGQTIVVRNGTVLAVEAFEGTNEAIKRGGTLARGRLAMMIKVAKPQQDVRFDVPVIGPKTIEAAAHAGVDVIVVEAGRTLLLDKEGVEALCHGLSVSLIAAE